MCLKGGRGERGKGEKGKKGIIFEERGGGIVCVCVCVCVRERERERYTCMPTTSQIHSLLDS